MPSYPSLLDKIIALGLNGNVDLTARPRISKAQMIEAGYTSFDGDYATLYSATYTETAKDGSSVTLLMTPITPDGMVFSPANLNAYVNTLCSQASTRAQFKAADSQNLLIHFLSGTQIAKMDAIAEQAHELSDEWETGVAFIRINNMPVPYPKRGLTLFTATIVDSARNANGVTVGQKIGRDQYKLDNLEWPYLSAAQWSRILKEFAKNFYVTLTFPDMVYNKWRTVKAYPGDRTAEPYWISPETGLPTFYINCRVNIIDCGE